MSGAPDDHGLARQVAVLEERMKTMQAEYKTDIGRLAEDMAKRDTETAKRETRIIVTMVGLFVAAVTVLGVLIRL